MSRHESLDFVEYAPYRVEQRKRVALLRRRGRVDRRFHGALIPLITCRFGDLAHDIPIVTKPILKLRRAIDLRQIGQVLAPARKLAANLDQLVARTVDEVFGVSLFPARLSVMGMQRSAMSSGSFLMPVNAIEMKVENFSVTI